MLGETSTDAAGTATLRVRTQDAGAGAARTEEYRAVLRGGDAPDLVSDPSPVVVRQALPRVEISTDDGHRIGDTNGNGRFDDEDDRSLYSPGSLEIDPRGSTLPGDEQRARFRIRGNSTSWIHYKLPYRVKLDKKAALLGMPASKEWVLLANSYDRTMLRNEAGFEAARLVGLPWVPRMQNVELWLNGTYAGVYQLGEKIEVEPDRLGIEVDEDGAGAADAADGGYLLEADSWDDDKPRLRTTQGAQIYLDTPGFDSDEEATPYLTRVREDIQAFEDVLYSEQFTDPATGYRAHVDVEAFVDWYLVNELMKNIDAHYSNSCWMYRDNGGLLAMGPVWDFDFSAGNRYLSQINEPTGWYLRRNWYPEWGSAAVSMFRGPEGHWLTRMFADPWFEEQVVQRWQQVRADLFELPGYVGRVAERMAPAAERNFAPVDAGGAGMPIGPTFMDGDVVFVGSWSASTAHLQGWLTQRLAWMDEQLRPAG